MKKILIIAILLISVSVFAQKVDVFNSNHNLLFLNVERSDVAELVKDYKGRTIYLQEWIYNHTTKEYEVYECIFNKIGRTEFPILQNG